MIKRARKNKMIAGRQMIIISASENGKIPEMVDTICEIHL
jgi:hypothetical protein